MFIYVCVCVFVVCLLQEDDDDEDDERAVRDLGHHCIQPGILSSSSHGTHTMEGSVSALAAWVVLVL